MAATAPTASTSRAPIRPPCMHGRKSSRLRCARLPELQDVSDDMEMKSPRIDLVIDRDKAAARRPRRHRRSRTPSTTDSVRSGHPRSTAPTTQYRVLLELDPKYQQFGDSLKKIAFKTTRGAAGAARVGDDAARYRRSADRKPCRPIAGGVAVVRPQARRVARRGGARVRETAAGLLPPTVTVDFRARRKRSRSPCAISACCSRSPSASSTSCSACSTRATFIR